MDIKESALLRDSVADHWYYRSKAKLVGRLLRGVPVRTILDVGAGSGFFSRHLLRTTRAQQSWCVDVNYAQDSDALEDGKALHFRREVAATDADLVLLMDVLEHVDDDVALLRETATKAAPAAHFLISVPAFQFMWSAHDVFLEHRRRYTLTGIERVVRDAGLRVVAGSYFFAAVFPAAMLLRLPRKLIGASGEPASDMRSHSRFTNGLLYALSCAELPLIPHNRCFGLTACCVATRA